MTVAPQRCPCPCHDGDAKHVGPCGCEPGTRRCEHYTVEVQYDRDGRARPGLASYCLKVAEDDGNPPRCALHRGTVTGADRLEATDE